MGYSEAQYVVDELTPIMEKSKQETTDLISQEHEKTNEKIDKLLGGFLEFETAGNHDFELPYYVDQVQIIACAGGGGGGNGGSGSSIAARFGGGGGGGGEAVNKKYNVTDANRKGTITVGNGGAIESNGGNTVVGSFVTLVGGKAGTTKNAADTSGTGGAAGGPGGGKGGDNGARDHGKNATNGSPGLTGRGGKQSSYAGGGGGSLGQGCDAGSNNAKRGGGGAGSMPRREPNSTPGAPGYVCLRWGAAML